MPLDVHDLNMLAARLAIDLPDRHELYDLADRLTSEGDDAEPLIEIMVLGKEARYEEVCPLVIQYVESRGVSLPIPRSPLSALPTYLPKHLLMVAFRRSKLLVKSQTFHLIIGLAANST